MPPPGQDIAGRFLAQQKTGENLQQQIVECEQKREELEAKLKELELERAELKFHQTPSSIRYVFTPCTVLAGLCATTICSWVFTLVT